MTVIVLKSFFQKAEPKDYQNFSNNEFKSIINTIYGNFQNFNNISLSSFMKVCKEVLDKVETLKQKCIRANIDPFMNKDITKATMKQPR